MRQDPGLQLDYAQDPEEGYRLDRRAGEVGDSVSTGGIGRLPEHAEAAILPGDMKMHRNGLGGVRNVGYLAKPAPLVKLAFVRNGTADAGATKAGLHPLAISRGNGDPGGEDAGGSVGEKQADGLSGPDWVRFQD